jgi:hypothetical protein
MAHREGNRGVSPDEIWQKRTAAGGWTKATLAEWGVAWPPPAGWKRRLEQAWYEAQGKVPPWEQRPGQMDELTEIGGATFGIVKVIGRGRLAVLVRFMQLEVPDRWVPCSQIVGPARLWERGDQGELVIADWVAGEMWEEINNGVFEPPAWVTRTS